MTEIANDEPVNEDAPVTTAGGRIDFSQAPDWFHSGQRQAWASSALDTVIVAGTGGGKTAFQSPWLLREIQRAAPFIKKMGAGKFIYAGPTLSLLAEQAIPSFEDLFTADYQLGRLVKGNKARFYFSASGLFKVLGFSDCAVTISFAYTNDSSNLESMVAMGGVWDEAGQKENKQASYRAYNRRLKLARSTTFADIKKWIDSDKQRKEDFQWWVDSYYAKEGPKATFGRRNWGTTPYDWNWFKYQVYDRAEKGEDGFSFYNFASWMNPNISENECRKELELGMDLWDWEMMYLGVFRRPAGLIYAGFDHQNQCEWFNIPDDWPCYVGMDFGNENTAAVIIRENPHDKVLYVTHEYRRAAKAMAGENPYKAHAREIKALSKVSPRGGAGGSHQEDGWREAMRQHGIPISEPPINNVEVQFSCVIAQINTNNLVVFKTCEGLITEFGSYSRELDENLVPIDGTVRNKAAYHFLDSLRYVITWRHPPKARPRMAPTFIPSHGGATTIGPSNYGSAQDYDPEIYSGIWQSR